MLDRGFSGYRIRMAGKAQPTGNYLAHYGIMGQRWGIRRFQNEDRTLTEAGKRRYSIGLFRSHSKNDDDYAIRTQIDREKTARNLDARLRKAEEKADAANDRLYEAENFNLRYSDKESKIAYSKAYLEKRRIDREIKDIKILQKINNQKRISQHRLNLEEKYRKEGMSEEEAKVAAYKRDKTEKIVAIAAVTTLAVASAWLYKNHMADIDKVIPKDTVLQNLSADPNKGVQDAFYASYDPADNRKYMRLFGGGHLQGLANNPIAKLMGVAEKVDVQKMTAQAMSEMKIAGANIGRDTVNELISNSPNYRQAIKDMLTSHGVGSNKNLGLLMEMNGMPGYMNVQDAVYNGKVLNNQGYNFINRMLVDHSPAGQAAGQTLFEALKRKGYDGTIDLNDVFNSGYDAKAPVLIFNGGKKLGNVTRATIDPDTLQVGKIFELAKVYGKQILNMAVPGYAGIKGAEKIGELSRDRRAERELIRDYRKEHPNTKLSDKDILKNIIK